MSVSVTPSSAGSRKRVCRGSRRWKISMHKLDGSPATMVATLNRLLRNSTGGANYVTFFYAEFDEGARRLAYVNAGHNPPILFRADHAGDFRELSCGGM